MVDIAWTFLPVAVYTSYGGRTRIAWAIVESHITGVCPVGLLLPPEVVSGIRLLMCVSHVFAFDTDYSIYRHAYNVNSIYGYCVNIVMFTPRDCDKYHKKISWYNTVMSISKTKTKQPKLTVKQSKFVAKVVGGETKTKAYKEVYKPQTENQNSIHRQAHEVSRKPQVQAAIDAALNKVGATPEFAVQVLAEVAEQDKEIGARRLAAKDILELHGWRKDERPQNTLQITNAFFSNIVESNKKKAIDVEQ